ncbi:hypothetical protein MPSEU_000811000 [Mayamaea pseudoterrestris]|nr:hypothetical protein MPSEU_000811000 [Mayamaea pseudoterrestris]
MVKPIPDNIKEILNQLHGPQQVTLKTYIASLRSEINSLQEEILATKTEDPHAHFHGHEKCTMDHGHASAEHKQTHDESKKDHGHEHKHEHSKKEDAAACDHKHDCGHDHNHKHDHHEDSAAATKSEHSHKEHSHGDHKHDHKHGDAKSEVPAWKTAAASGDAHAAPFGGTWDTEASLNARKKDHGAMDE